MYKALHAWDDIDCMCPEKKEETVSIQDSDNVSIQWLEDYIKSAVEHWFQPLETTLESIEQK